jgi:hypothetical protein
LKLARGRAQSAGARNSPKSENSNMEDYTKNIISLLKFGIFSRIVEKKDELETKALVKGKDFVLGGIDFIFNRT